MRKVLGDVTLSNIRLSERRLFYVAISRAKNEMFILTKKDNESEFIVDSGILASADKLNWHEYVDTKGRILYKVKVSNYDRRENSTGRVQFQLKKDKYRWSSAENCWHKSFYLDSEDDDIPIFEEEWLEKVDYINIEICDITHGETIKLHKIGGEIFRLKDN